MSIKETKSKLAKLLATENISVQHGKYDSASFDTANRILRLPILKEMSGDIYDLMVLHEVGHALYTPDEGWREKLKEKGRGFMSFLNVIEDARIEKKIKRKYPGGRVSFLRGYKDLMSQDFFSTKGVKLNSLNFIDRINLYFKAGVSTGIKFNEEESTTIKEIGDAESFSSVLDIAERLYDGAKEKMADTDSSYMMSDDDFDDSDEDHDWNSKYDFSDYEDTDENSDDSDSDDVEKDDSDAPVDSCEDGESSEEENDKGSSGSGNSDDDGEEGKVETNQTGAGPFGGEFNENLSGEPRAYTDDAWKRNMETLLDDTDKTHTYVNIPKVILDRVVVDYKEVHEYIRYHYTEQEKRGRGNQIKKAAATFIKFKTENAKVVAYLAKEFEMKKAADEYKRTSMAKTGLLDMNRIYTYKYNDDIFRKVASVSAGKNHGLVMFIDWSGSMSRNMRPTIEQLLNLVMFCKKVQIPFEVYSFTDRWTYSRDHSRIDRKELPEVVNYKEGDQYVCKNFRLLNLFSSKMSARDLQEAYINVMALAEYFSGYSRCYSSRYIYSSIPDAMNLGGTPLNDTIIAAMTLIPKFQNDNGLQIVNSVFLTDGESAHSQTYTSWANSKDGNFETKSYWNGRDNNLTFIDPVTHLEYDMTAKFTLRGKSYTKLFLEILKGRANINSIGFFLTEPRQFGKHGIYDKFDGMYNDIGELKIKWKKDKFLVNTENGYDELYIIHGGNHLSTESKDFLENIDTDASKAVIRKAFAKNQKGKLENRVILEKFIEQVA